MKYEIENGSFVLSNDGTTVDTMSKVGIVVDCYSYPDRDPILIKHGELERVKKYYNEMKLRLLDPEHHVKNGEDIMSFAKELTKSLMFVDASNWTADELNRSLDTTHYIKKILIEKGILK